MVRINGTETEVFLLDTISTFKDRVAVSLGTLPKYLRFPAGNPSLKDINSDKDLNVIDLLEIIKKGNDSFGKVYENIFYDNDKQFIHDSVLDPVDDVLTMYVISRGLEEGPYTDAILLSILDSVSGVSVFDNVDVFKIFENRKISSIEHSKAIEKLKKKVADTRKMFEEFQTEIQPVKSTKFDVQRISFEVTVDTDTTTLLDTFNAIRLTPSVPFANTGSFYKILKDFTPDPTWQFSDDNSIILYALQNKSTSNIVPKDFSRTIIIFDSESGLVKAASELETSARNIPQNLFIDRIFEVFPSRNIQKPVTTSIGGVFYYPNHTLNRYVFSDLVMTNSYFSSLIYIDERKQATKMKTNLYLHFYHPKIGAVTATILQRVVDKTDQEIKKQDKSLFPLGSSYVRVMMGDATDENAVEAFMIIMSKLMAIYDKEYKSIVSYYRKFIPDFAKKDFVEKPTKAPSSLEEIEPRLFLSNYTRKCGNPPTIISDEQASTEKRKVMVFPKDDSIVPQRNYICPYEKEKFPGLRKNPLENSDIFPFIPCCYIDDQSERPGSRYRRYFHGEVLSPKKSKQSLFLTGKMTPYGVHGTLPENITRMFKTIDMDNNYMYTRVGVDRNESSFLHCVMKAIGNSDELNTVDNEEERLEILNRKRFDLATPELAAACQQEMFDYTIDEIREAIRNPKVYLDPKLFIHMLEIYFECNIYIFTKTTINGELSLPRHMQAYYKTHENWPTVMIFEHSGTEANKDIRKPYMQCELICKTNRNRPTDIEHIFDVNSPTAIGVSEVFESIRKAYAFNDSIEQSTIEFREGTIIGQRTDSFGKTRILFLEWEDRENPVQICVLTTPLQPMNVFEIRPEYSEVDRIDYDTALRFAMANRIIISGQTVEDEMSKQLTGIIGNVRVAIPIIDSPIKPDIPITYGSLDYPIDYNSRLTRFNNSKKYARYVMEYMYWLYSTFLHTKNYESPNEENMVEFMNDRVVVIPNFKYGPMSKLFSLDSGVMTRTSEGISKLVINSDEALKSMFYGLRWMARRDKNGILDYRNRTTILKYYEDITDMDQYSFQVILEGKESVMKWIDEKRVNYVLYDVLRTSSGTPYFFKNKMVGPEIYLMQPAVSMEHAVNIAKIWQDQNYNPGLSAPSESSDLTFLLYAYVDKDTIMPYIVDREETDDDLRVMGCSVDGEAVYFAMLPTN